MKKSSIKSSIQTLNEYDLYLTYSWSAVKHGICGHTFEVIDYYNLLKNHISVAILMCDLDKETFTKAIIEKYIITDNELQELISNTIFLESPKLLRGTNIFFTDGAITNIQKHCTLLMDNVFMFACGDKKVIDIDKPNYHILLDQSVYQTSKHINYIKMIDLKRLKKPTRHDNKTLIYATENCRYISQETLDRIPGDKIVISNTGNYKNVENLRAPIDNLFERFNKYVYTPIDAKWDCSPRFIVECKYFGIDVQYTQEVIDYLDIDLGLRNRILDLEHTDLQLQSDDKIINIIKDILND